MPPKIKTEVRINDPALDVAIRTFAHWRSERAKTEKLEDEAKAELVKLVSGYHKEHNADVYRTSDNVAVTVGHSDGAGRLSGDRLLELGVLPDTIAKATSRTPYNTYTPQVTTPVQDQGPVSLIPE